MKRQNETLGAVLSESMEWSVAKIDAALASGIKLEPAPVVDPYSKLPLKLHRVKNEDGEEGIEARVLERTEVMDLAARTHPQEHNPSYANSSMDHPARSPWDHLANHR